MTKESSPDPSTQLRPSRYWPAALAVMLPGALALYSCTGGATKETAAAPAEDAGSTWDTRVPKPDDAPPSTSPLVPPGWRHFGEYNNTCALFVPESPAAFPAPIRWEPCANILGDAGLSGPDGMVCRQAASDWNPDATSLRQLTRAAVVLADQRVVIAQRRVVEPGVLLDVVAEADGNVSSAIMSTGECVTFGATMSRTHYLYQVLENFNDIAAPSGLIVGEVLTPSAPRVLRPGRQSPAGNTSAPDFVVGKSTFVEMAQAGDTLRSLATSELVAEIASDLSPLQYRFADDDLFWVAASSTRSVIRVRPANGDPLTLLDHGADEALAAFATDGDDMVWTRGVGRISSNQYTSYEMWTAKFTTSPSGVVKHRLRAVEASSSNTPRVVGCGHVAHQLYGHVEPFPQMGFRLIRLADGRTWDVLSNSAEQTGGFRFEEPHAITCDEVFVEAYHGSNGFLTRIKISSLGPGTSGD